ENAEDLSDQTKNESSIRIYKKFTISTFKAVLEGKFTQEDGLNCACSFTWKRFPFIFWSEFEKHLKIVKEKTLTTMLHSEFLMRVFRNKAFKTLLCKEARQNTDKAHQIAKTIAKDYVYNKPKRSSKAVPHCKHLYQNFARKFTNPLRTANFIELLRHWLDINEFIDNLYDPDFMRRMSANDIIVLHILAGDHMPFLYE
ncbi:18537_t:CDS:2, partial [Racocetra persica]